MKDTDIEELASKLFEITEDSIYTLLEKFDKNPNIDKSLTYIFIKAFYIHVFKLKMNQDNEKLFEDIYSNYRVDLEIYYKSNNSQISAELLNQLLEAFDNSFKLIESLEFREIDNSYEFRHHVIDSFELLRKILEKKSKAEIRTDIFEDYISEIIRESEKIDDIK